MLKRKIGRLGYEGSVVMFGAASLGSVTQEEADQSISYALNHGVNHFDTAADYGDAEVRLGPIISEVRNDIFLATKTGQRTKEKAKEEIYRSLERMRVDSVDLLQLHAVGTIEELDKCTAKGGALEAAIEAKEEGIIKAIGITGHGHQAPVTHLEALKRFSFDTVLLPLNYYMYSLVDYRAAFDALMAEANSQNVAVRVIKAIAKAPWEEGQERNYATWYEPFDRQEVIDACVHFVLSFPGIAGFASAGDIHLFPKIVDAVERYGSMNNEEAERILSSISGYTTIFGSPTSIA
ncbi:Predicted oxidoreductase of the aldo/keto reductase family [Fictibacillus enclensis]|uniref:Aldo/keto reductase n=1 Tax=Fictibacillus enclensis TaxID=1017270 RepID=A0A0V8JFM5_9BACL|nr:aldo/keto reductase [Fictibacillus enclensis]KSU85472.1 aldo/keto reductase [Fictibacillus enclensis]SCB97372.1 Predicted oxidoreductase of the aldo/keto reductase family [Fictibacillus enclensis]